MARYSKNFLIPLAPLNYNGELRKNEQNCAAWHVLSRCKQADAFITFINPSLASAPDVANRLASEFFASKDVIDFERQYEVLLGRYKIISEEPSEETLARRTKNEGESDDDFKKRRKREAAELIVDKIIDKVDDVEEMGELIDTIRVMDKTKFFEDTATETPPMRYLPVTCSECEYKRFIDEQTRLGNIKVVD